jgi:hypothetical protein
MESIGLYRSLVSLLVPQLTQESNQPQISSLSLMFSLNDSSIEQLTLSLQYFYQENSNQFPLKGEKERERDRERERERMSERERNLSSKESFISRILQYIHDLSHSLSSFHSNLSSNSQLLSSDSPLSSGLSLESISDSSVSYNLLSLSIDCLRICLRDRSDCNNLMTREFIDLLLFLFQSSSDDLMSINLSTASIRCLTNLLNLNDKTVEIFLSLNGLTWLLSQLQNGGHIVHIFYLIRLLYMLISQRY